MTYAEFRSRLKRFRDTFEANLHFNIESPQRLKPELEKAISYLDSVQVTGTLAQRTQKARALLQEALQNIEVFEKTLKPDPADKDLGASSPDPMFWYQQVIGTSEAAMNEIIRYLDGTE